MDQTPVYFNMASGRTLNARRARSVNVRSSTGSTMRLTLAVGVTAAGSVLPPLIVYKAKVSGRIIRETRDYPEGCSYATQPNAWMDERVCMQWVDEVVTPWVATAPEHIVPMLILDSYRCHLMESVVTKIQDLGVEVKHIPGGLTSLCQPVDVGINKPLKNRIRRKWEQYMIYIGIEQVKTQPPSRQMMAQWCIDSLNDLGATVVQNAWKKTGYSYFPNEAGLTTNTEDEDPRDLMFV